MRRGVFIVVSLVCITSCKEINPEYCGRPENMDRRECMQAPCQNNDDCASTPDKPVCDTSDGDGVCVQCTADNHALCGGKTPRCENRLCVTCVDDGDCGENGVCLPAGDCADPSRIIHAKAANGSTGAACGTIGNECALATALTVVSAERDIIKLDDATTYTSFNEIRIGAIIPITIAARGATLTRSSDNEILRIEPSAVVTLLGGAISNARNTAGHGIACKAGTVTLHGTTITNNDAAAIVADLCTLTIDKSIIINNSTRSGGSMPAIDVSGGSLTLSRTKLSANEGGGVRVTNDGAFVIVGNLFHDNGGSSSSVSGLVLDATAAPMNRLEFNTIVDNHAGPGIAQGLLCNTIGFTAQSNIVWSSQMVQPLLAGSCTHSYSDIRQDLLPPLNGPGNINADPLFESPSDFRVKNGSPVDGKADPAANVSGIAEFDLEGRKRPMGQADIGAYEVPTSQ